MYCPSTGQIKKPASGDGFVLEDGKNIPEQIVIPLSIEPFNTGYNYYEAKFIDVYAPNANSSIFHANGNANTTIIIPEGVTTILSYAYC
jgi:hypothetical protein